MPRRISFKHQRGLCVLKRPAWPLWSEMMRFLFFLFSSILYKNGKHIYSPIQAHMEAPTAPGRHKDSESLLAEKKGGFSFFPFILFTPFYLPLVHTMEAIVAFAAAKTGHKVLSNLCHMACLCFALPTASPLKILQPQWHSEGRMRWIYSNSISVWTD